jgi:RND family efflux transporter MFP subunit
VSQPLAGQVAEVRVRVGDAVKEGQVLARFDSLALRSELARAGAQLVAAQVAALEAEVRADRAARAAESKPSTEGLDEAASVAEARFASASAAMEAEESSYRLAARRAGQGTVKAPLSGVVLSRAVAPGETVPAGAVLMTLDSDPGRLLLEVTVDEADVARLAVGLPARFSVPAYPGRAFRAKVGALHPLVAAEGARRMPVTLELDAPGVLRPGMSASAEIATVAGQGVVRGPLAALSFRPRGTSADVLERSVWIVDGATLRRVTVEVGEVAGGFAELRSPQLHPGVLVAVGYGAAALRP